MSWDSFEYDLSAKCACGNGIVIRHILQRDDDWNRSETRCLGEEIHCADCAKKYHIEHLIRHYFCMPWDGDGISDRAFLVPNGIHIPKYKEKRIFSFSRIDEQIAADVPLKDIKASINDMQTNKYTTRLELGSSREIVLLYQRRYKKKSLKMIIPVLETIIQNYDKYEWTPETITEYRITEEKELSKNNKEIAEAISKSFELDFRRN